MVTEHDRASVASFTSPRRRIERLAWRAALRTQIHDGDIEYDSHGAPHLSEHPTMHIGVSHTTDMAAVIISPRRCAVDIELSSRNLDALATRFMSESEMALQNSGDTLFAVSVWCAKEAMYKYYGERGLDFIRDMEITKIDRDDQKFYGRILKDSVPINILQTSDYTVAYIVYS
jgi:phosphopantetheinyl transferase